MMGMVCVCLVVLLLLLTLYIVAMRRQIRKINIQLKERIENKTQQVLHLDMMDGEINRMAANVNKCLEIEREMSIRLLTEEKNFQDLIANVSHDLRTPVTAIKGYLQLAARTDMDEGTREEITIALRHCADLERRIHQFFEYSYHISNEELPRMERVNLSNFIMEGVMEWIPSFEEDKKKIVFEQEAPVLVLADLGFLVRIFQNLMKNAFIHSKGDVFITIREGSEITMLVTNSVNEPEQIKPERLFDRLYVADKSRMTGTGLGLTIVRALAEKMGGRVFATMNGRELSIGVTFQPAYK